MPTHQRCWASPLGDCDGGITGEHVVSAGVLASSRVQVEGLPWCRDEPRTINSKKFVVNRLCKRHNEGLSEVDAAAKNLFDTLDSAALLDETRRRLPADGWAEPLIKHQVSGRKIERWLLKTVINITVGGQKPIGDYDSEAGIVHPELVGIAFGHTTFSPPYGLYGGAIVGERMNGAREWEYQLLGKDRICGVLAKLRGIRLGLSLIPYPLPTEIQHVESWRGARLVQPFAGIQRNVGPFPSQHIEFTWDR